jgi:hypothetical protein
MVLMTRLLTTKSRVREGTYLDYAHLVVEYGFVSQAAVLTNWILMSTKGSF